MKTFHIFRIIPNHSVFAHKEATYVASEAYQAELPILEYIGQTEAEDSKQAVEQSRFGEDKL